MRTLVAVLIAVACLPACKTTKEKTVDAMSQAVEQITSEEPQLNEKILGSWTWWKTNCCFRMPKTTYATEIPYEKILTFNKGDTVETYHNDTLKLKSTYEVYYGLMKDDDRPVLKLDNRPALLYINGDTLIVDYGYMDLQTDYYLRRK